MTTRVLVTGALGYVGGRLIRHLAAEPDFVVRAGFRDSARTYVPLPAQCEKASLDLLDVGSLEAACVGVDHIVHLAALNDPDCRASPERAFRVNCLGAHDLVTVAKRAGVRRIVYISTAHVYGAPLVGSLDETRMPRPVSLYALTHRCAEDIVLAGGAETRGVVLRLSNAFGAPADPGVNAWMLLANDLCRQAVEKRRLVLQSPGLQWRDFVTMTDVTRGIAHLLRMPENVLGDGVFNLGGDCSLRIIDFAERVRSVCQRVLGFSPDIERPMPFPGDPLPDQFAYQSERLKGAGFQLGRELDGEIENLLRFCEEHFKPNQALAPKENA